MSPETIIKFRDENKHKVLDDMLTRKYDTSEARSKGYVTSANGCIFSQEYEGVIPETMRYLMEERDNTKTLMKQKKKELEKLKAQEPNINHKNLEDEIQMLDMTQLALKILANSGYGCLGQPSFRYYLLDVAEAITSTGKLALLYMMKCINEYMNDTLGTTGIEYAIYGDTDSIFVSLDKWVKVNKLDESNKPFVIKAMDDYIQSNIEPLIASKYKELEEYMGSNKNLLIMKREALGDAIIFRGKKNYIMQVYDNEGVKYYDLETGYCTPYLKMMGVETAKTSTAKIIRSKLEECFRIVINKDTKDVKDLKLVVDNFRAVFNETPVLDIAAPRGVNDIDKWVDSKGNIIKGCPIHVRASINYNTFIKENDLSSRYEEIKNGSKIKFVKLKEPNLIHSYVVAFIDDLPDEMELDKYIDRKGQFDETFLKPLESFTSLISWDVRRNRSLGDLFGDTEEEPIQVVTHVTEKVKKKKKISIDSLF